MAKVYTTRYLEAQRASGYKNSAMALAELVDNSFDAEAKNVEILFITKSHRGRPQVHEILVADDGKGMDREAAEGCLGFGVSEDDDAHIKNQKRIGKFGVGLSQASQSQCRRFEIYSWQNNKSHHQYFDYDCEKFIASFQNNEFLPVQEKEAPSEYISNINDYNAESGCIVRWSNCDRLSHITAEANIAHCNKILGRIYRYKIESGDYKISFTILRRNEDGSLVKQGSSKIATAFDPLFLMQKTTTAQEIYKASNDNSVSAESYRKFVISESESKPTSEKRSEMCFMGSFKYQEKDYKYKVLTTTAQIGITKPGIRNGGNTDVGKVYLQKSNLGNIYFVRGGREIDCGHFGDFYTKTAPEMRFASLEIQFDNDMDELFGVSNSKQGVAFVQTIECPEWDDDDQENYNENYAQKYFWYILSNQIARAFKDAKKHLKEINTEWDFLHDPVATDEGEITTEQTEDTGEIVKADPDGVRLDILNDEEEKQLLAYLQEKFPDASVEKLREQVKRIDDTGVRTYIFYRPIPNSEQLYVYNTIGLGNLHMVQVNTDHPLYAKLLYPLQQVTSNQSRAKVNILTMFELLVSASVIEEEKYVQIDAHHKIIKGFRTQMAIKLSHFVDALFAAYPNIESDIANMKDDA